MATWRMVEGNMTGESRGGGKGTGFLSPPRVVQGGSTSRLSLFSTRGRRKDMKGRVRVRCPDPYDN